MLLLGWGLSLIVGIAGTYLLGSNLEHDQGLRRVLASVMAWAGLGVFVFMTLFAVWQAYSPWEIVRR